MSKLWYPCCTEGVTVCAGTTFSMDYQFEFLGSFKHAFCEARYGAPWILEGPPEGSDSKEGRCGDTRLRACWWEIETDDDIFWLGISPLTRQISVVWRTAGVGDQCPNDITACDAIFDATAPEDVDWTTLDITLTCDYCECGDGEYCFCWFKDAQLRLQSFAP
jgi:hypothetical protein